VQEVRASPGCFSEKTVQDFAKSAPDGFGIISLFRREIAFARKYLDPAVFHFERDNPYTVAPTLA
jgi:hypothetical protein